MVALTDIEGEQFIATDLTLFSTEESKVNEPTVYEQSCMGSCFVSDGCGHR